MRTGTFRCHSILDAHFGASTMNNPTSYQSISAPATYERERHFLCPDLRVLQR